MPETIVDCVFGKMEYKHSWTKKEELKVFGKTYLVNITAQAYKGNSILEEQRAFYVEYKKRISKIIEKALPKIEEYCTKSFNLSNITQDNVISALTPKTVLFQRDGTWGLLFDCIWDEEHGVGLLIKNDELIIGPQDILL